MSKARDYKKEYRDYHSSAQQRKRRSMRNKARRALKIPKNDPREVDHKTPLSKGGGNSKRKGDPTYETKRWKAKSSKRRRKASKSSSKAPPPGIDVTAAVDKFKVRSGLAIRKRR